MWHQGGNLLGAKFEFAVPSSVPTRSNNQEALPWPKQWLDILEALLPVTFIDRNGYIRGPDYLRGFGNVTPEVKTAVATGNAAGDEMMALIGPVPDDEIWRVSNGSLVINDATAVDLDAQGVFDGVATTANCKIPHVNPGQNVTIPATADLFLNFPYAGASINNMTQSFFAGFVDVPPGYYYGARIGVDVAIPDGKTVTIYVPTKILKVQG